MRLILFCNINENKIYLVHVHVVDFHHQNEKNWQNSSTKKIPSLIFHMFRDGQVSFDIKNKNLYGLYFFLHSAFKYLNISAKKEEPNFLGQKDLICIFYID
jgi:hypothetical protein